MRHYVDIGVVRIQRYLSRTPTLVGRRGASSALVTAMTVDDSLLAGRAGINPEAGRVDGVLSLVMDQHQPALVDELLARLRTALPGAEFEVACGDGEDYLDAHARQIRPRRERGQVRVDLPAGAEFPLAALCGICRVDPAVGRIDLGPDDGERDACADCVTRHSPKVRRQARTAERRLAEAVGFTSEQVPHKFDDLAALASGEGQQHLATVHADGNRVGEFFARLAERGRIDRASVVAELSRCTFAALAAATTVVRRPGDPVLCVVPHLLGGDDVLVSLPAERAWRFTVEFVHDFGQRTARLVRGLGITDLDPPTMSAGVVFGRRNFPFALTVEQAEDCLTMAKRKGAGKSPWIGFADVVVGTSGPAGNPVSLAALRKHGDALSDLVALPRSNQHRLVEELGRGGLTAARTLAARLGHTETIGPFLRPGTAEHGDDEAIDLAQALRIARWWR